MPSKMLIITNRRLHNKTSNDETLFGENPHINGPAEVRLAWAHKDKTTWKLDLLDEPDLPDPKSLPSRGAFRTFKKMLLKENKNCVFYIHGYNKSFDESLSQGWDLQKRYNVGVIVFSWASNPGGLPPWEYPKARAIARSSSPALDMTLEKMARYMSEEPDENCTISINLLIHSLGNYVFQSFVEKPLFSGETRIFDNLILHQADVDNEGHQSWIDKLRYSRRVYVTINEKDKVLDLSDVVNPDRLGNTNNRLECKHVIYVNFTNADKINKTHQLFGKITDDNQAVKEFFYKALNGEVAESSSGMQLISHKNIFDIN